MQKSQLSRVPECISCTCTRVIIFLLFHRRILWDRFMKAKSARYPWGDTLFAWAWNCRIILPHFRRRNNSTTRWYVARIYARFSTRGVDIRRYIYLFLMAVGRKRVYDGRAYERSVWHQGRRKTRRSQTRNLFHAQLRQLLFLFTAIYASDITVAYIFARERNTCFNEVKEPSRWRGSDLHKREEDPRETLRIGVNLFSDCWRHNPMRFEVDRQNMSTGGAAALLSVNLLWSPRWQLSCTCRR